MHLADGYPRFSLMPILLFHLFTLMTLCMYFMKELAFLIIKIITKGNKSDVYEEH